MMEEQLYLAVEETLKQFSLSVYEVNDRDHMDFPQAIFDIQNVTPRNEYKNMATATYSVQVDLFTDRGKRGQLYRLTRKIATALRHISVDNMLDADYQLTYTIDTSTEKMLNRAILTINYKINEGVFK